MAIKTLTYSEKFEGWPSFYSFFPDWMIGMNNYFYTFNEGNLYRHNTNETRNQFYGVNYPSYIKTVLNEFPLSNKIHKTISLIGDDPWDVLSLTTDLQSGRNIDVDWFEEKESSFFAYIRNNNDDPIAIANRPLRSLNGIAQSISITNFAGPLWYINFSITPIVEIPSSVSVGDYLYYLDPPDYSDPIICGIITAIERNYPLGRNRIQVDVQAGSAPSIGTNYFMSVKNQIAESNGILGHYCVVELENNNTDPVELFTLQSEIMKSYP